MRRSRSHVPHPVPHLMELSSMEPFVNLLAELQRHCNFAAICEAVGRASVVEMSTSPSLCLDVFGHMTCSPPKLGLTNSRCFAQWQQKFNRAMSNVTFHSKGPCFLLYVRTSGPEKSAMRIPNLQAATTQLLKDSFSRGIASCSLQLLLGVMNAQAIHDMLCPLVHKQ